MNYKQEQLQKAIVPGTGILVGRSMLGYYNMAAFFAAEPSKRLVLSQTKNGVKACEGPFDIYNAIIFARGDVIIGNSQHTAQLERLALSEPAQLFAEHAAMAGYNKWSSISALISGDNAAFHMCCNPYGPNPQNSLFPVQLAKGEAKILSTRQYGNNAPLVSLPVDANSVEAFAHELWELLGEEHRVAVAAVRIGRHELSGHRETCIINKE